MALATIPPTQRAYALDHVGEGGKLTYRTDQPDTQPKDLLPGQFLVHLTHSGVCHSDLTIKRGVLASAGLTKRDLVGGHEGVGTVVAIGEHTRPGVKVKVGDRVGVKWIADTCNNCAYCQTGDESCAYHFSLFCAPLIEDRMYSYGQSVRMRRRVVILSTGRSLNILSPILNMLPLFRKT